MKQLIHLAIPLLLLSTFVKTAVPRAPGAKRKAITISYSWSDGFELADKLADRLSTVGFAVWFDKKDMVGDMYQSLSVAVESCDVFLLLMSPGYFNTSNCRREAEYAADLNKKIVPIKATPDYTPKGWLGILQSGLLYYDFSDTNTFEIVFDKLLLELA